MKTFSIVLFSLLITVFVHAQSEINVADFNLEPNTFQDATKQVKQAIAACEGKSGATLVFPKGRYDFWPEKMEKREYFISNTSSEVECPSKIKNVGLLFENMENLTIEGNGSIFVFHGKMITWALDHCKNIKISNLTVDFERPTMSEMKFIDVTPEYITAEVHPDSKYMVMDGKLYWYGDGWGVERYHVILKDITMGTAIYSSWDPIGKGKITTLEPLKIRIDGDFKNTNYKAGQVLTVRDPYRDHVGAFVNLSENVQLENVTMHYMHGLGIVSQFSKDLTYKNVNIVPSRGRAIAAFADGMHFSGCRGEIKVEECHFKGLHDDPVNVHGTYLRITEIHSPEKLTVSFMHHQTYGFPAFFENDTIAFIQAKSLQTKGIALVKKANLVSEREMQIELDTSLPKDIKIGDCLENITWTPSLEVKNNIFEMTNTRGVLVTTPRKVVIENNIFKRTGMYGVLIAGDAGSWFESGAVNDVTIRNNIFDGCGYNFAGNSYAISVEPENHETSLSHPVHRNISIENNIFKIYDTQILRAKSTENLIFENNIIETGTFTSPLTDGEQKKGIAPYFKFDTCSDVFLNNNLYNLKDQVISTECINMQKKNIHTEKPLQIQWIKQKK